MQKPLRSSYEISISRKFDSQAEKDPPGRLNGFFVEDKPSKILGSRAEHPHGKQKTTPPRPAGKERNTINKGSFMNIYMTCNFTLSNKLQKLVKEGSLISLSMGPVEKNKAKGYIRFELENGFDFDDAAQLKNTSIMFEPEEIGEDVPEMEVGKPVQSFGATGATVVEKIAITNPKEHKANVSKKIPQRSVSEEEKKKAIKAVLEKTSSKTGMVTSYEELIEECNKVPNIDASPLPSKKPKNGMRFTRQESIEYEKELMALPKLTKSAYIKNNSASRIEIGDITIGENNLILAPYEVFDLSRLSAKVVRNSSHLRSLVSKYLSFVDKEAYEEWVTTKSGEVFETTSGYKAFSGENAIEKATGAIYDDSHSDHRESSPIKNRTIGREIDEESIMEVTAEELDSPANFDSAEITGILKTMPRERPGGAIPENQPRPKASGSGGPGSIRRV